MHTIQTLHHGRDLEEGEERNLDDEISQRGELNCRADDEGRKNLSGLPLQPCDVPRDPIWTRNEAHHGPKVFQRNIGYLV